MARQVGQTACLDHSPVSRVALGDDWVLRWDSAGGAPVLLPGTDMTSGEANAAHTPAGDIVVFDGYVLDGPGLAAGSWDVARIAERYARRAESLFEELRGGFAAAVWDPERRRLTIGRDALGLHPCFYAWDGRVLLAAASLDALLARREIGARVAPVVVWEYLADQSGSQRPEETFHAGVHRVPAGHRLTVEGGAASLERYWDPLPPGFEWASEREQSRFDEYLERAVARCLDAGADSIALSGGFDSVSVAALAARQRPQGPRLRAVSLAFDTAGCDERETQVAAARALGMPHLLRTLNEALGGAELVEAALSLSRTSPSPVLSPWQSAYSGLLREARAAGARNLLFGTGGDELMNVDPSYGQDCLASGDLAELWRFVRACQRTSRAAPARLLRGVLWTCAAAPALAALAGRAIGGVSPRALDWVRRQRAWRATPGWVRPAPELAAAVERRRRAARAAAPAGSTRYVAVLRQIMQQPLYLIERDQSHAWARHLGVRFLFPYLDRDLVELALRMPPRALIAGGRHKTPLRRLVAAELPSVRMPVRKVDFTAAVHRALRAAGRALWRRLGGGDVLAEHGLVDGRALDRFMEEYFAARHDRWLGAWNALSTAAWLEARAGSDAARWADLGAA